MLESHSSLTLETKQILWQDGKQLEEHKHHAWRIIPFSKWLITWLPSPYSEIFSFITVSLSPFATTYDPWDDPPSYHSIIHCTTQFLASIINHYFTDYINMTKQIQTVLTIYSAFIKHVLSITNHGICHPSNTGPESMGLGIRDFLNRRFPGSALVS